MSVQATDLTPFTVTHNLSHLTSFLLTPQPQNIISFPHCAENRKVCCRMHLILLALQVDNILYVATKFSFKLLLGEI